MKWWGSFISAVAGISVALVFSVATQSHALTLTRDLKQGYSGADVSNLQQFLKDRGFYTYPEITTYYGPATKEAVAAFQRMKGIPPLGGVGPSTRAALNALSATTISSTSAQGTTATKADLIASLLAQVKVLQARLAALIAAKNGQTAPACSSLTFTRALDIGARGTDVSDLQTFLQARGYLSADSVTGYFGPLTSAAVKAFQKANRIDTVGTVGSITRATITSLSAVCAQFPSSGGTASTTSLLPKDKALLAPTTTPLWPIPSPGFGGDGGSTNSNTQTAQTTPAPNTATPGNGSLTDASSNVWTVTADGVIMENGAPAGYSANVILLLLYNNNIYQENNAGSWWKWTGITGALWQVFSGDPRNIPPPQRGADAFFGMHYVQQSGVGLPVPPDDILASQPIGALAKGTLTDWTYLEQSRGTYDWRNLDYWVQQAADLGVDYYFSFGGIPKWATSDQSTCIAAALPNTFRCSALPADMTTVDEFVTALVTRYKGKIAYYELMNEPYYVGTAGVSASDLATFANRVVPIIRSIVTGSLPPP